MSTHITFVLDSSGSMGSIKQDTIGGFNEFLADQRQEDGEATVSLYEFNTTVNRVFVGRDISNAPELTEDEYVPGGSTALYDAIAAGVDETDELIAGMAEAPSKVIVVILTDGRENASETSVEQVKDRIEDRKEADWEFLFIGANQDAALTAGGMGIDDNHARNMQHNPAGVRDAMIATSRTVSKTRRTGASDGFSDPDNGSTDEQS